MALVRIRYKGLSDVRIISKKDAERHNVSISDDLVWDHRDGSAKRGIVVDGLSDELLDVLKNEGTFTVTEVDKDTKVEKDDIIKGAPLDDTGSTVKDSTTGQVSKPK
jgi:hypothetical protein